MLELRCQVKAKLITLLLALRTCLGLEGSWGYEYRDAQTFASWGVDFMKLDCCNTTMEMKNISYPKWTKALNATGRSILYRYFLTICDHCVHTALVTHQLPCSPT